MAMIFQNPMSSLNPTMNIERQIAEGILLHNFDKKSKTQVHDRVDELLTLVGINPVMKRSYPHELSGGMRQRVGIAIALACNPELLIADEPTSALDVTIQAQVLALMNELKQRLEMSMLLITHDFGIIARMCDKMCIRDRHWAEECSFYILSSCATSTGVLLHPSNKLFLRYDHPAANFQHGKVFFMHQFVTAGGGYAQDLSDRGCVEKQRQIIIVFVLRFFHLCTSFPF